MSKNCPKCGYPLIAGCANPGCEANPHLTYDAKAIIKANTERHEQEAKDRELRRKGWEQSYKVR